MKPIQWILIPTILVSLGFYFLKLRTRSFDRCLVLLVGSLGVCMLIVPSATTSVARLVGVNRGADLLFYVALLAGAIVAPIAYCRMRATDQTLTALVRAIALDRAHDGTAFMPDANFSRPLTGRADQRASGDEREVTRRAA